MVSVEDVAAVLVTRGDCDLTPILDSLPFSEMMVWDNADRENLRTYGRHQAVDFTSRPVCFTQDDDHVFWGFDHLLAEYEPGVITANMDEAWVRRRGYEDMAMFGRGAVYDRDIPERYLGLYLEHYPRDEFFLLYCDVILGVLAPTKRVDVGCFRELDHGYASNRMNALPGFERDKALAKRRARAIRDGLRLPA